jgi:hypothetical protein
MRVICTILAAVAASLAPLALHAHSGPHASIHDTVAGLMDRLGRTLPDAELRQLTAPRVLSLLTPGEREALGAGHLHFHVNTPVTVTVLVDPRFTDEPFWLAERGFRARPVTLEHEKLKFAAWERDFPAGDIALGVNSLAGGNEHYLVLVKAADPTASLEIADLYPGQLRVADFVAGVKPYADRDETLKAVPAGLAGRKLVRTLRASRDDARVLGIFRWTDHPASPRPDHVVLTWSGDPRTTQAIQWRTSPRTRKGAVTFARRADLDTPRPRRLRTVKATSEPLNDPRLLNAPVVWRHTVELTGLEPGTTYAYAVGDGSRDGWGGFHEFTTAPAGAAPFSFIYMGDAQNGLDRWGSLVQSAFRDRPDAAFYLLAGDLVNRGNQRDDWDGFFHNARGVFDRRTLVPVIGNHECQGGQPTMYLRQFALPRTGPPGLEPERAYAFDYGSARFIVLDSNLEPAAQVPWLEQQLATSRAAWKFVSYHHPAYSSAVGRTNTAVYQHWTPLFDKYHVDLVLQGHDHAYLRTYPLKAGQRVASAAEGTVYLVSVSGTKFYPQAAHDYTELGMTNVATYQVLDIQVSGDRLVYRAIDGDGAVRDRFVIEKPPATK